MWWVQWFSSEIYKKENKKITLTRKKTKIIFVGKKAFQALKRENAENIIKVFSDVTNKIIDFNLAKEIGDLIISNFDKGTFDSCNLIYTQFNSAINQEVKEKSLVPLVTEDDSLDNQSSIQQDYHYEPDEENILNNVVPQNLSVQLFTALLESVASEQGARMTAMDNATRNANDMIDNLTLFYNRSRQAVITKELIEIISGAEAI